MSATSLKKDWVLNQEAFDALLVVLDRDRERAGARYEHIRHALITFFECRGSATPEDQADDTINRVARRLLEGKAIHVENPVSYFYGVARNVLKEYWESRGRAPASLENLSPGAPHAQDPHRVQEQSSEQQLQERRIDCLERCLDDLPTGDREMIRQYLSGRRRHQDRQQEAPGRASRNPYQRVENSGTASARKTRGLRGALSGRASSGLKRSFAIAIVRRRVDDT